MYVITGSDGKQKLICKSSPLCGFAGRFVSDLVGNPEAKFSGYVAHMKLTSIPGS